MEVLYSCSDDALRPWHCQGTEACHHEGQRGLPRRFRGSASVARDSPRSVNDAPWRMVGSLTERNTVNRSERQRCWPERLWEDGQSATIHLLSPRTFLCIGRIGK